MHFNIMTLFPELFPGPLSASITGKAHDKNIWSYSTINIRDFATDNYRSVDDTPFGGGAGMVMRADILESAFLSLSTTSCPPSGRRLFLSPRGTPLTQKIVQELTQEESLTLLCGRYEGIDQRFLDVYQFEEISIGDYILAGGEIPALALMEACIRLLPGAVGNAQTPVEESFSQDLLEYPQYTKPADWIARDGISHRVPDILRSGDHKKIKQWRESEALSVTRKNRPDLLYNDEI